MSKEKTDVSLLHVAVPPGAAFTVTTLYQTVRGSPATVAAILNEPSEEITFALEASSTRFDGSAPTQTVAIVSPAPSVASVAAIVAVWCETVALADGRSADPAFVANAAGIVAS